MPIRLIDTFRTDPVEEVREDLARGGLKTAFSLNTPAGWRSIDSPYEPRGEAKRLVEAVPGESVLVLGTGSGFVAERLVELEVKDALLVTGVRTLAERNLKRLAKDGREFLTDLLVVAGDDPERIWTAHVQPWLEAHPNARLAVHPRESKAQPALHVSLELHVLLQRRGRVRRPEYPPKTVLFSGNDGLLERETIGEFEKRGIRVVHTDRFAGRPAKPGDVLERFADWKPGLVLSMNNLGSDPAGVVPEACEQLGIPWATWLLDDPRFLVSREERLSAGKGRVGFCWDWNGVEGWRGIGFSHAEPLPLATDPALFSPGTGDPSLDGRIVFVGSPRFASAEGFFHTLDENPDARRLAEHLGNEILASRKAPDEARLEDVLNELDLSDAFEPEARRRLPAYAVQQANLRYRSAALAALAPLRPVVYGAGWEGLLPDDVELRAPVDYYRDLPAIYRSDAVHISLTNLQMSTYPNQRVFDVAACGRCVITDSLAGLEELFGEAIAPLTFDGLESMRKLAENLAADSSLRGRLADGLRRVVLQKHTIAHRVDRIIEVIGKLR